MPLPTLVGVERRGAVPTPHVSAPGRDLSPGRACALPLVFIAGLVAFILYDPVRQNPRLLWSFLGAAAVLTVWNLGSSGWHEGQVMSVPIEYGSSS